MDEIRFGPERAARVPPRYRRPLSVVAAVAAAGAIAAGGVHALTGTGAHTPTTAPRASAASPAPLAQPVCPPGQLARPDLSGLPAQMRPGALRVVIDAQFSGRCPATG